MKRALAGKRTIITGASSGIGRALAAEAAREKMRLVLAARSAEKLQELAEGLKKGGADVVAVAADVTVAADRARLVQTAVASLGGLDVLINNAGVGTQGHFMESSPEILRQVMEVNFFAPAELIRLAVPVLEKGEQPAIVNVSSMTGRRAMPMWPEYSASKFALAGLSESLRCELFRHSIDVLLIVPGMTDTNIDRNLLSSNGKMVIDFRKGMPAPHVARAILTALRKNRAETVLGLEARWLLRLNRLAPAVLDYFLRRAVRKIYDQPDPGGTGGS